MILDAAGLQVLVARLNGVADEMGAVLRRAASSPNIKERADCSAACFTADGELLAQAEHIPVHLGAMPAAVRAALSAVDSVGPGDQIVGNDPFRGGTHLNDVTLVAPVFVAGELIAWVANRAHHADLGGIAPGSMPPDAVDVDEEGLRLAPTLLTPDVEATIVGASRTPDERRGDLDAQRGANVVGARRLAEIVGALGGTRPLRDVVEYGERRMRAALAALPDGTYRFEDALDSAGPRPEQQHSVPVVVTLTIAGDTATFDFTGTGAQQPGNVNAVEAVTVSAVAFAIRAATDPSVPANGGALRPVRVAAPAGSIVAAVPPVAVGAGNVEVSQRVADVCLGALAQAAPDRLGAASQGTMNNVIIGSAGAAPGWVYYETLGGGQGGRPWAAGMSGVHTAMTNTADTPVEALERELPLRVRRYGIRRGTGGAGAQRGGDGIERELEVLEPAVASLITERRLSAPWGLEGGEPGAPGENWLLPGGDEARATRLGDKVTVQLQAGDVLRVRTPGGGGWRMPPTSFDRYVMVDWSASSVPTRGANSIWIASVDRHGALFRENPSTRHEAMDMLREHLVRAIERNERVLLGFDAALGYPVGFAAAVGIDDGRPWRAVWDLLASRIQDDERNRNNRYDVAGALNRAIGGEGGPFWSNGLQRDIVGIERKKCTYPCVGLAEYRLTEHAVARPGLAPKSVWQLSGAGSVGGQTLTLLPRLAALLDDPAIAPHARVWPFETGFVVDPCRGRVPAIVIAEVWPSLVDAELVAEVRHDVKDARQVTALARRLRERDLSGDLAACFADPGVDRAVTAAVLRDEGWILQLGY